MVAVLVFAYFSGDNCWSLLQNKQLEPCLLPLHGYYW